MKQFYTLIYIIFTFTACLPIGDTGGTRINRTACTDDTDCNSGYFCLDKVCGQCDASGDHNCTSTTEPVCYNNSCVECTNDNQTLCTNDGKICGINNTCQTAPTTCASDVDCTDETTNKKCDLEGTDLCVQCLVEDDCDSFNGTPFCENKACVMCREGQNSDCNQGFHCVSNNCVENQVFNNFPAYIKPVIDKNGHFGFSVAMFNDKLLIGSPGFGTDDKGKVYYYQIGGSEKIKLVNSFQFGSAKGFGKALSMNANYLIAYFHKANSFGYELLKFENNAWVDKANWSDTSLYKGWASAFDPSSTYNQYTIGIPNLSNSRGQASFFNIDTATSPINYQADPKHEYGDNAANQFYGYSLAAAPINGSDETLFAVGYPGCGGPVNKGRVEIWRYNNNVNGAGLQSVDEWNGDNTISNGYFGTSVSIAKNGGKYYVLAGAPRCAPDYYNAYSCVPNATGSGKNLGYAGLNIFHGSLNHDTFKSYNAPVGSKAFGYKVIITNDLEVFISDPRRDNGAGKVYKFSVNGGDPIETFAPPAGSSDVNFGGSIAVFGSYLVVGSFTDDRNCAGVFELNDSSFNTYCPVSLNTAEDSGAVYIYKFK